MDGWLDIGTDRKNKLLSLGGKMTKQQREPGRERERESQRERQRGEGSAGRMEEEGSLLPLASSVSYDIRGAMLAKQKLNRAVESIMNQELDVLAPQWLLSSCVVFFNNVPKSFHRILFMGKCGNGP